jgi:hypothetical protein
VLIGSLLDFQKSIFQNFISLQVRLIAHRSPARFGYKCALLRTRSTGVRATTRYSLSHVIRPLSPSPATTRCFVCFTFNSVHHFAILGRHVTLPPPLGSAGSPIHRSPSLAAVRTNRRIAPPRFITRLPHAPTIRVLSTPFQTDREAQSPCPRADCYK